MAGGVAIAAVLGVLVVRQGDAPPSAAPTGVTGVEALVHVTSIRADQTDEQAAERMERVLTDRARIQGITGFAIERSGADLSVFVPRTQRPEWVRGWLPVLPGPQVYDLNRSVLARGTDPIAVARRAGAARAGVPMVHYLVVRGASVSTSGIAGPFATRADAAALEPRVQKGARAVRIMEVPASVRLVSAPRADDDRRTGSVFLALGDPVVQASEITAVRASGNRVDVDVATSAGPRVAAAMAAGARPVVVEQSLAEMPFVRFDAGGGSLVFRSRSSLGGRRLALDTAGGGVDAVTTVQRSRRVGPVPAPVGTPVTRPGRGSQIWQRSEFEVIESTVRRVLDLTGPGGGSWWVWAARTRGAHDTVGVVSRGRTSMVGTCDVEPRRPLLFPCMSGGSYGRRVTVGRVGDAVRTITAVTETGTRVNGAAANGFFLLLMPQRAGAIRVVILRDRTGTEVGRVTSDDPISGVMLGGPR